MKIAKGMHEIAHFKTGHLSHQIEHHLFPDLPAHRYAEIAPEVRAICEKHGLPYNTGSFFKQTLSTWKRIAKLSLPSRKRGPLKAETAANDATQPLSLAA